jgi:putative addiction module component (TIGR02574 family)
MVVGEFKFDATVVSMKPAGTTVKNDRGSRRSITVIISLYRWPALRQIVLSPVRDADRIPDMARKVSISDVLQLTPSERILLVEEIWDSIASIPESVDVTAAQREELDRRLEAYHKDPTAGDPWEVAKARYF